ncbi:MAG: hypothetical protein EP343_09775 [Deltaproteobacteria bacterium]|nr:MAG: hypothetical protein EP343_09775 [Deltaproteobacteria bacterium]
MSKLVRLMISTLAVFAVMLGLSLSAHAQQLDDCDNLPKVAQGEGYGECLAKCYAKHCGTAGLRCPTVQLKNLFKVRCRGKCREMMRRKQDMRRLITFCRGLKVERERAARYRRRLILRHNMWMAKRKLVHRLRMQYQQAKARRQAAAARAYYRRMNLAHAQQMQLMREKIQMKAKFYMARAAVRHRQRMELINQVGRLKKDIIQARAKGDKQRLEALRKVVLAKNQKVYVAEKKEKKLKVEFHKAKVNEKQHDIKEVKVKKAQIQEAQIEAKKKNDQKRLEDLAKQLGELAGKQAALTRQAEIERQKLKKAKVAYASVKQKPM